MWWNEIHVYRNCSPGLIASFETYFASEAKIPSGYLYDWVYPPFGPSPAQAVYSRSLKNRYSTNSAVGRWNWYNGNNAVDQWNIDIPNNTNRGRLHGLHHFFDWVQTNLCWPIETLPYCNQLLKPMYWTATVQ